ncbi:MAG: aminopeptidase [Nanoarchaeota archaeon]|nr:aminopeptidase [Nanoarchaeota archaeon]
MKVSKLLDWLKAEGLFPTVELHYKSFSKIFEECLVAKDEPILIIGDFGYPTRRIAPILAGCYIMSAKELGLNISLAMQEPKNLNEIADEEIINKMLSLPEKSVIIQVQSGKLGSLKHLGKSFRKFCKDNKHRFTSTGNLGDIDTYLLKRVILPMMVDYDKMKKNHLKLKSLLDDAKEVRITTKAGTDIIFDIRGVESRSNDGIYHADATGGNIPAGEVYLPPKNSNGKVVIDVSSRNAYCTAVIEKPIVLEIKDNQVISISGGEEADILEKSLRAAEALAKYPERIRVLAELGIGLNPKAKILGLTIVDEKCLGTAHVAIGSNYWFGGANKTIIHFDQVFNQPRIFVDGKRIRVPL